MALPQRVDRLVEPPPLVAAPPASVEVAAPIGRQAFQILRAAFVGLLLVAGVDKFFDVLGPWPKYLAPDLSDLLGVAPQSIMHAVGVLEILTALLVAVRPSVGGWLVAVWLWTIAGNLLILPGHYDVVLRDLALSLGAIALARLASRFER
jgi:hypothetical protein